MIVMAGTKLLSSSLPLFVRSVTRIVQCKQSLQSVFLSRSFTVVPSRETRKDVTESASSEESKGKPEPTSHATSMMARTTYIDKKTLVWDKRYKSVEDVPDMLPYQTVVQARNRFRIRANLVMIGLTVVAALVMIYTGKERAKAGDSVEKRTLERHRQLRAEKAEEDRVAAAGGGEK